MGCLLNPLGAACPAPQPLPFSFGQVLQAALGSRLPLILGVLCHDTWEGAVLQGHGCPSSPSSSP